MDLGEYNLCLDVRDLEASMLFYGRLGFEVMEDHREDRWAVMRHANLVVALYQGHLERNLLNFRGGDVAAIHEAAVAEGLEFVADAHEEHDGSWSAELVDPDGNHLYFNTFPDERERYLRDGRLLSAD